MKNILYFGGFYAAEFSSRQSFSEKGYRLNFPVSLDYTFYQKTVPFRLEGGVYGIKQVAENDLRSYIKQLKPRPIIAIHRYYKNDPVHKWNARELCRSFGIPYIVYRIETYPLEPVEDIDCDLFLYAHKCDKDYIPDSLKGKAYHFPYGVSNSEQYASVPKQYDIASFGLARCFPEERKVNFLMYYNTIVAMDRVLDVFWEKILANLYEEVLGSEVEIVPSFIHVGTDYRGQDISVPKFTSVPNYKKYIRFNEQFSIEKQVEYLNKSKIVVNVDETYKIDKCYSYKMFQSLGCGAPTITSYKKGIEEDFGPNWETAVYVKNEDDVKEAITVLSEDKELREKISKNSCEYMHEKYDWFNNFNKIMVDTGLWKQ